VKFDVESARMCRVDFPSLSRRYNGHNLVFFDGPGGTQTPSQVIDAVGAYYKYYNSNAHGMFITTRETEQMIRDSREAVADFLGANSWKSISFGANMTTLSYSLARAISNELGQGDEIVITELDHEANRGPWIAAAAERGAVVKEVRLLPSGELDYDDMRAKVSERTKALAMGMSSNALGTVNDVGTARELCKLVGAYLILDAVHYAPHIPIDADSLDADFLLCSAYKFYGPHVGILCSKPGSLERIATQSLSTQSSEAPFKMETGTLNHEGIAGTMAAVNYIASLGSGPTRREKINSAMTAISAYEHGLAIRYYNMAREIPGVRVYGPDFNRLRTPTVSITIDGISPRTAAGQLGEKGICVWDGDFYAAKPIDVLQLRSRGGLLRAGFSLYNTPDEVDRVIEAIASLKV
jgi:cysteine desulfurase family protein (TIGR01976 family)